MDLFKAAAVGKYRFPTSKGKISTEDLWDLPVSELDLIFRNLNATAKETEEESLIGTLPTAENEELKNKISILRLVAEEKKALADARLAAKEKSARKQKLLAILAEKQDVAIKNMSAEDIEKMIAEL